MNIKASKSDFSKKRVLYRIEESSGCSKKLIVFGVSERVYNRWAVKRILII
jgi:hypothetical protein